MVSAELVEDKSGTIAANGGGDSTSDANNQNETAGDRSCQVCGAGPCTTRCSLCKLVYYCSVDCQRIDWTKGSHRKKCTGKQKRQQPKTKKSTNSTPIVMGPSIPPPASVHNEDDAKRALQELWTIADSEMQEKTAEANITKKPGEINRSSQQPKSEKDDSFRKTNQNSTFKPKSKAKPNSPVTKTSIIDNDHDQQKDELQGLSEQQNENIAFVVEEMPQICRFQLTLTKRQQQQQQQQHVIDDTHTSINDSSIGVSAKPIGRSRTRTLVIVQENDKNNSGGILFRGEFPRPIHASDITWRVVDNDKQDECTIVFRLPYPYDPSNTSSLALGGSIDHSYYDSTVSDATLDEINTVVCGTCHLPLIVPNASTKQPISRVFPLPQGHWDEIADYLICYDGQPVVDFSAGSECAEPSIALQDASLLCFHRKDVEQGVCALAVDGYGELAENNNDEKKDVASDANNDLGEFLTKPSSSFVLPNPPVVSGTTTTEEKKDESTNANGEPEISATSAVVRGDRTWQDAVDGESVSLCCARCCSALGFASLGSPETWRFWKHRLSKQVQAEKTLRSDETKTQSKEKQEQVSDFAATMSFAVNTTIPEITTTNLSRMQVTTVLPVTKPMASCSSFLARELVRYAESKAIFTFVVRREGVDEQKNECLLLRLLSWETAMATSYHTKNHSKNVKTLLFRKVAKIVFEVTVDPTITNEGNSNNHVNNNNGEAPAQWFWGGVDLCCPPPTSSNNKSDTIPTNQFDPPPDTVSTARLELPNDEYNFVLKDLISGKALFEPEIANATILLKMGGLTEGLGLTAVAL